MTKLKKLIIILKIIIKTIINVKIAMTTTKKILIKMKTTKNIMKTLKHNIYLTNIVNLLILKIDHHLKINLTFI